MNRGNYFKALQQEEQQCIDEGEQEMARAEGEAKWQEEQEAQAAYEFEQSCYAEAESQWFEGERG